MKRHLCCLALAVLPAFGQVGSTAIYTEFEDQPPESVVDSMKEEIASIMSPGGLRFEWRSLSHVSGSEVFTELAVARFKGRCIGDSGAPARIESGALAWSHITDGEVLPFTDVDCDRISSFLKPRMIGLDEKTREKVFGRAIGRVLAHELFHIFARTKGHGSRNVDKPYYSASDLISDDFRAGKEFHILAARSSGVESRKPSQTGLAIYAKSGCNNCHGSQGQGSKRAPALRVAGRWIDGVVLAARLETSGPRMARRAKEMKIPGPSLAEEDIDVLVRFLNALE
jgi:Cytochrome c